MVSWFQGVKFVVHWVKTVCPVTDPQKYNRDKNMVLILVASFIAIVLQR